MVLGEDVDQHYLCLCTSGSSHENAKMEFGSKWMD